MSSPVPSDQAVIRMIHLPIYGRIGVHTGCGCPHSTSVADSLRGGN